MFELAGADESGYNVTVVVLSRRSGVLFHSDLPCWRQWSPGDLIYIVSTVASKAKTSERRAFGGALLTILSALHDASGYQVGPDATRDVVVDKKDERMCLFYLHIF